MFTFNSLLIVPFNPKENSILYILYKLWNCKVSNKPEQFLGTITLTLPSSPDCNHMIIMEVSRRVEHIVLSGVMCALLLTVDTTTSQVITSRPVRHLWVVTDFSFKFFFFIEINPLNFNKIKGEGGKRLSTRTENQN